MKRFVEGADRGQSTLLPECLDDWISEDNPVRAIDVFVDELDLADLGFGRVDPKATGRPAYHPSVLLKLYIYGYLNRVQSSRRLEREAGRNVNALRSPNGRLVFCWRTVSHSSAYPCRATSSNLRETASQPQCLLSGKPPRESCFGSSVVDQVGPQAVSADYFERTDLALTHRWANE